MKKTTITIMIMLSLLIFPIVTAYSLSEYPEPFLLNEKFNAKIVIGDKADASDIIGATDIISGLQYELKGSKINDGVVLASEIEDNFEDYNLILVGGPCANPISMHFMGYPDSCIEGFDPGIAYINMYPNGNNKAILVAGLNPIETRVAAQFLSNHNKNFATMAKSSNNIKLIVTNIDETLTDVN